MTNRAQKTIWRHFIARKMRNARGIFFVSRRDLIPWWWAKPKSSARPSALMLTRVRVEMPGRCFIDCVSVLSGGKTSALKDADYAWAGFGGFGGSRFSGEDFW